MPAVDDMSFNGVFVSYAHEDKPFAQRFKKELQDKLGNSIYVWMDDNISEGKEWRREIQRVLNSTALVILILSPDAIKSPWVQYEWHYCLLEQQSEPFLVHFRMCRDKQLKRFTDFQLVEALVKNNTQVEEVWTNKAVEINEMLDRISARLKNFSDLRREYDILTNIHENPEAQRTAAYNLGNVPDGLKLAAANYLIQALQFWLSHGVYGPVGASIANELGRLGKRKATPSLVQLYLDQANPPYYPVLNSVQRALALLACEEPI